MIERALLFEHDLELDARAPHLEERSLDLAWVYICAADQEHVVQSPVNAGGKARIGASAHAGLVDHVGLVARVEADHWLGFALKMRIDDRAALSIWEDGEFILRDDLCPHLVLHHVRRLGRIRTRR